MTIEQANKEWEDLFKPENRPNAIADTDKCLYYNKGDCLYHNGRCNIFGSCDYIPNTRDLIMVDTSTGKEYLIRQKDGVLYKHEIK
jgi:hypothetical protein